MSKRAAETQRDGHKNSFMDLGEGQETAQRATSAQMANRQIRSLRGGRRTAILRRPGLTDSPSKSMPQATQTPLGNVDPNAANGTQQQNSPFQFGSQSFGGTPQPKSNDTHPASQSASFPSFGNNTNTSSGFQFAPPNAGFNFAPGPGTSINNPFASLAKGTGTPSPGTHHAEYQGSLFKLPAQAPPAQTTPAQTTAVSDSAEAEFHAKNPTLLGQRSLFDQLSQQRRLATGNPFSKYQTSQSADVPASNPFANINLPQTNPSSSTFAQETTPSTQLPATKAASGQARSPDQATLEGDSMSTTPDTSPQTKETTPPNLFTSIQVPDSPTPQTDGKNLFSTKPATSARSEKTASSAPPSQTGSLLDRISQPAAVKGQVSSTGAKAEATKQGGDLFDRISHPTDPNAYPEARNHVFSGFGQPANPTTTTEGTSPEKQDQHGPKTFSALPQNASRSPNFGNSLFSSKTPSAQSFAQEPTPPGASKAVEAPPAFSVEVAGASSSQMSSKSSITEQASDGSLESFDSAIGSPMSSPMISSEDEKLSQNTLWRLKALNAGIKKLCSQVAESEVYKVMSYYEERKQAIIDAGGQPLMSVAGSKRQSSQDGHESSRAKKPKVATSLSEAGTFEPQARSALTNGVNGSQHIFSQASSAKESSPGKRKADEDPPNNLDGGVVNGAKKTRMEGTISSPSLSSAGSETSNIFKSIVNNPGPGQFGTTPKSVFNGANSAQGFSESPGTSRPVFPPSDNNPKDATDTPKASNANVFPSTTFTPQSTLFTQSNSLNPTAPPTTATSAFKLPGTTKNAILSSPAKTATEKPPFKPPVFGSGAPVNFISQFSKAAAASEQVERAKAKQKRKAEDFDPDEDNEDEWERKDAAEQLAKKQKLQDSLNSSAAKFVPGNGFNPEKQDPTSAEKPMTKPPAVFGSGSPASSLSQFGKAAGASEELVKAKEKAQRKAEDSDYDEDDEDDLEQKDAEEQSAKKQNLGESLQGKAAKFVPGKGLILAPIEQANEVKDTGSDEASSRNQSRASSVSVFDQPRQPISNGLSIFGHLSDVDSGTEGSKKGDADDEGADSESSDEDEEVEPQKSTSGGRSLFDRISNDENGKPIRQLPPTEEKANNIFSSLNDQYKVTTPNSKAPAQPFSGFALSSSSSPIPKTNIFGQTSEQVGHSRASGTETSPGDHTWKVDSPIKFGETSAAPSVHVTSPSPSKSPFGGLFGSSNIDGSSEMSAKSASSLFGSVSSKGPSVGFDINFDSKAARTSLAPPSDTPANDSSRATSPGASSIGDSQDGSAEDRGNEEPQAKQEQIDLTKGPGEEDEENLFEVRGKALTYDNEKREWVNKGVGPLRVLKHPETGKTRILLRQDPSGKIAINTALLSGVDYVYAAPKSVKMAVAMDNGKLATYMIRVGKDEDAKELTTILQENKTN